MKGTIVAIATALAFIILLADETSAMGISPSTNEISYDEDNGTYTKLTYHIVNNELNDQTIKVYFEGELKQYLNPQETIVDVHKSEQLMEVSMMLSLPPHLNLSSTSTMKIIAEQIPEKDDHTRTRIMALSRLVANLQITPTAAIETQEKLLDAKTTITKAEDDDLITVTTTLKNRGSAAIKKAAGMIEIRDGLNNKLYETKTEEVALEPYEEKNVTTQFRAQNIKLQNGEYDIITTIIYDNLKKTLKDAFNIGQPSVSIESITGHTVGNAIRLNTTIKSEWNGFLKGVTANFIITDTSGKIVKDATPPEITVSPFQVSTISTFMDSTQLNERYTLKVLLNYAQKTTKKEISLTKIVELPKRRKNSLLPTITTVLAIIAALLIVFTMYTFMTRRH